MCRRGRQDPGVAPGYAPPRGPGLPARPVPSIHAGSHIPRAVRMASQIPGVRTPIPSIHAGSACPASPSGPGRIQITLQTETFSSLRSAPGSALRRTNHTFCTFMHWRGGAKSDVGLDLRHVRVAVTGDRGDASSAGSTGGEVGAARLARRPPRASGLDAQDLAGADRDAAIGDVERSVRADGDRSGSCETVDHRGSRSVGRDLQQPSG